MGEEPVVAENSDDREDLDAGRREVYRDPGVPGGLKPLTHGRKKRKRRTLRLLLKRIFIREVKWVIGVALATAILVALCPLVVRG